MSSMKPFEAAKLFTALKMHLYTDSYDYFKYGGKVKSYTESAFDRQNYKKFFYVLAKKYAEAELGNFFLANLLRNPKCWGADLVDDDAHTCFKEYQGRQEKLGYLFSQDVKKLKDFCDDQDPKVHMDSLLEGETPKLVKMFYHKDIHLETVVVLNKIFQGRLLSKFNMQSRDTVLWPKTSRLLAKYESFLKIDVGHYAQALRDCLKGA